MKIPVHSFMLACALLSIAPSIVADEKTDALSSEVAAKGWLIYSARSDNGTWDLFLSRPDGSAARNLTNTADYEEAAPRFSPDAAQILYRRLTKGETINHDQWGFSGQLLIAKPDGTDARTVGEEGEYPWASWMPGGKQVVCLEKKGIKIVELATGTVTKQMPRNGIYQQLFVSPDGKWFCGTGNVKGAAWNVVRMYAETGEVNPVHEFQSCTPDWFPDSQRLIYSSRPEQKNNGGYGCTQLWINVGDGSMPEFIYGDESFHIYGGKVSPDGNYVLFTKCPKDGGGSEQNGAPMYVMRLADVPSIGGDSPELRALHPNTKDGPILELAMGWEPDWTSTELGIEK
ncbi:MAG: PD40 domain-containing protein [Candidatus Hydrogenedentes bacterium]|nr:PD40 domain-containing protein [Candidatus Hydrogenedentota bacterium]